MTCGLEPSPTGTPPPPATATPPAALPPAFPWGDVDCDRTVDSRDAAIILQLVVGFISRVGCPIIADVNADSVVGPRDAQLILQFVAGLVPSLPP